MRRAFLLSFGALLGCQDLGLPSPDLERMIDQAKYEPMEASEFFEDGMVMRTPPAGTIPWGQNPQEPAPRAPVLLARGQEADGSWTETIPVPLSAPMLAKGKERFEVYCAVCHGILGDGDSRVAERMKLRRPPSLVSSPIDAYPPGRIYGAITEGYGFMSSYKTELSIEERWAVTAYVKALQMGYGVPLANLPAQERQKAEEHLP